MASVVVAADPETVEVAPPTVAQRVDALLERLQTDGDLDAAQAAADHLFDQVTAYAKPTDAKAFTEAAFGRRLVRQLGEAGEVDPAEMTRFLRANPKLARALAFLVQEQEEEPAEVYALLDRLRRERGDRLGRYANLAAAIAVVHDKPLKRRINENSVEAPDPVAVFDYFVKNEKKMLFGVRNVPPELLVYVVDTTASLDEMNWALNKYAGDRKVGERFFDIDYDYNHFRTGAPKRVTEAGFNLPNIRRHGGVCADQAYFAVSVGKSIGVPTAYTRGRSAEVGHAWVAFFQSRRDKGLWNFDSGRYDVYQGVRGIIEDPQTRQAIADGYVGLLAELIGAETAERHATIARTDAAARLAELRKARRGFDHVEPLTPASGGPPRGTDAGAQLTLLQGALEDCPGYAPAWLQVAQLASMGQLDLNDKRKWSDVLLKLCGKKYPDFTLMMIEPMVQSIDDVKQRNRLWESVYKMFPHRHDLAAHVRMAQGKMWEAEGDYKRAGRCYYAVITQFANAGPFVIDALQRTEQMLIRAGRASKVVELYAKTWDAIKRPGGMAGVFATQSNWYKVGQLYVQKLRQAGQTRRAATVESRLNGVVAR